MGEKTIEEIRAESMDAFQVSSQKRVVQREDEKAKKQGLVAQRQLDREAVDRSLFAQEEEKEQKLLDAAASFTLDGMPMGTNLTREPGDNRNAEDLATGGFRRLTPKR